MNKNRDVLTLTQIKSITSPIAAKYNIDAVYLFGSYARGDADEESDLDFLVFGGDKFIPTMIFAFAEELRESFAKNVDVFEIREVNKDSNFYQTIMNERLEVT